MVALHALGAAVIAAAAWSWEFHLGSFADSLVVAGILFVPFFGVRLIFEVGGSLLREEQERNRRAGIGNDPA